MSRTRRIKQYYPKRHGETYAVGEWISYRVYYPFKQRSRWHWDEFLGSFEVVSSYQPWSTRYKWVLIDPKDRKKHGRALAERHSESSTANERSPNRWHRQYRECEYRRHSDREIHRFMVNPEHEVIVHNKPKSHKWDWR